MIYKTYKTNSYNIYTIKTDKFKTCHMEIIFRNNIKKEEITKRSLLTELLVENTSKYNTRRKMIIELEDLYNSYFYGITNRVGSSILTAFCFDFINPKLVNEKIDEFIKFPLEAILKPNVSNDEFDITTFEYIKERVKKDIESIVEEPKNYSISKLLENMCKNTESKININGYIEDLDNINNSNLFDYYKEMIKHDYIDIYIIGNLDMDNVSKIIEDNFKINILKSHKVNYNIINKSINVPKKIYDYYPFSQENICIGYNIENPTDFEKNYVAHVFNGILGGGSLESKLYQTLRNENSLCYNCVSLYHKYDNLILLHTAISKENENTAINLMKKAMSDMKKGNITTKEIDNAKQLIITTINISLDVPGRIIDNYLFKNLYGLEDLDTRVQKYNKVTKQDIMNFAKKIKLNTILCVRDGENERNKNKQN